MKKAILSSVFFVFLFSFITTTSKAQTRPRNYSNGGTYRMQNGYMRSNGTYVAPHTKTRSDNHRWNNKNSRY